MEDTAAVLAAAGPVPWPEAAAGRLTGPVTEGPVPRMRSGDGR